MHLEGCAHAGVGLRQTIKPKPPTPTPCGAAVLSALLSTLAVASLGAVAHSQEPSGAFAAHHTLSHTVCHTGGNTISAARAAQPNKALQLCQPLTWDCAHDACLQTV